MTSTISVKNWDRFQHYKDRDPPWIKLYRDMLTSESWVLGTDISRLVQIAITLLAARYQNDIPNQFPLLKKVASFDFTEKQFNKAVEFLASVNFLEIKGVTSASNGLAHGASIMLATCNTETEQSRAEGETEQRQSRADTSAAAQPPVEFSDIKSLYPSRAGDNPWPRALKACLARLREGSTWTELTEGVRRYQSYCRETKKFGTEYVLQAATFFGPDKRFLEPWYPPKNKAEVQRDSNIGASQEWLRNQEILDATH